MQRFKYSLLTILIAFAIYFVSLVLFALASQLLTGGEVRNLDPREFLVTSVVLNGAVILGVWTVSSAHKRGIGAFMKSIGLGRPSFNSISVSIGLLVLYYGTLIAVFVVLRQLGVLDTAAEQDIGLDDSTTTVGIVYIYLALSVVTPLGEEFLYRGFIYQRLSKFLNKDIVIVLVSLLFAVAHWPPNAMVDTFILSIFMIIGLRVTGTLWTPVIMHALKNAVSVSLVYL
ncbi:MAG: CPBP family intramembrane glutamic endopeptidase [Patescibacteria group bacterium]